MAKTDIKKPKTREVLKAAPTNSTLKNLARASGALQQAANSVVPNPFKLLSGDIDTLPIGDFALGDTTGMLERWSQGRAPITFPAYGPKLVNTKFDPAIIDALSIAAPVAKAGVAGAKTLAPEIAGMAEKYALPMKMYAVPPETGQGRAAFLKLKAGQLDLQKEIIDTLKAKDLQTHLDAGRSLATYLPSEGLHAEINAAIKNINPAAKIAPLSKKEFYKTYIAQHKDIRNVTPEDREAAAKAILESGFHKSMNVNALPIDMGGPATDVIVKRYGNKAGDRVYLLPKEGVIEGGNGLVIAEGYKPTPMQVLDISVDREPSYEAYLRNFTKEYAQGGAVYMDKGGLNINATGDYGTYDSANESGSHYKLNTDIDILNKYGFGITKEGNIVKLPERTYTWSNDGEDFSHTEPARKIKRSNINDLRARYMTDDGIEYGISRQPLAKGWAGYRRNIKDNSTIGVNVLPDYTGMSYTKNFAEGGEIHPEFNFEQIKQYAEGGVVAHNDHNYAKGGPVLSVGRGEKLPVSQGAGLTAKGRAKYNSATGGNLKAPAPHPKTEKDANRRKSFCARMSGMPGPMKDENGNPTRKAASLKRWNC